MSKDTGYVLKSREYIGSTQPPATVLEDESRFGNDGAFRSVANPDWVQLPFGLWVLAFDGDAYVNCGLDASLKVQNITMMLWVSQPNTATYQGVLATADSSGRNGYRMGISNNNYVSIICGDAGSFDQLVADTTIMDDEVWRLVAGVIDVTTMDIYINGQPDVSQGSRTKTMTFDRNLFLGAWSDLGSYYTGKIALLRIYNCALSAEQIGAIYKAERHWFNV